MDNYGPIVKGTRDSSNQNEPAKWLSEQFWQTVASGDVSSSCKGSAYEYLAVTMIFILGQIQKIPC